MVFASLVFLTVAYKHSIPAWFDRKLAGYVLEYGGRYSPTIVHDRKSGFFLLREVECDGALLTLELTQDHHDLPGDLQDYASWQGLGKDELPVEKPLSNLSTGKGVAIGDSPAKVIKRLGKPTKVKPSGARGQYTDYMYRCSIGRGDGEAEYTETYTFKHGLLIQIVFFRDQGVLELGS